MSFYDPIIAKVLKSENISQSPPVYRPQPAVQLKKEAPVVFRPPYTQLTSAKPLAQTHNSPVVLQRMMDPSPEAMDFSNSEDEEENEEQKFDPHSGAYSTDQWEVKQLQTRLGQQELDHCARRAKAIWLAYSGRSETTIAVVCVLDVKVGDPDTVFEKRYLVAKNGTYQKPEKLADLLADGEKLVPGTMPAINSSNGMDHAERNIVAYLRQFPNLAVLTVGADKDVCWSENGLGGCAVKLDGINKRKAFPVAPPPLYKKRPKPILSGKEKIAQEESEKQNISKYFVVKPKGN